MVQFPISLTSFIRFPVLSYLFTLQSELRIFSWKLKKIFQLQGPSKPLVICMDLASKSWRESLQNTPVEAKLHSKRFDIKTQHTLSSKLHYKRFPLPSIPYFVASSRSFQICELPKTHTERLSVRTRVRLHLPWVLERGWAGSRLHNTFHSLRSGTPLRSGDWSGRPPLRRVEAPKRRRRLPIPTGCQNKSSLLVTTELSGGRRRRRTSWGRGAAVRGQVEGELGRGPQAPAPLRLRAPPPPRPPGQASGAFCLAQSGHFITFRTPPSPSLLSSLPLTTPHSRRRPPTDCRPAGSQPSDVSARAMSPLQKVVAAAAPGR